MNKLLKNRFLPLFLAFSVCVSLLVLPVSASSNIGSFVSGGRSDLNEIFGSNAASVEFFENVRKFATEDSE